MGEFMLYVLKLNLWTACCICAAILAGKAAVRKYLPVWKYSLWLVLSLALLFPVNVSRTTSIWNLQLPLPDKQSGSDAETVGRERGQLAAISEAQRQNIGSGNQITFDVSQTRTEGPAKTEEQPEHCLPSPSEWFLRIWLGIAFVLTMVKILPGRAALRKLKNSSSEPDKELNDLYIEICKEFLMKKSPRLAVNTQISGPFLAGIIHPCIYLPANSYTHDEIRLVLEHELCHYRRKDLWYKMLLNAVSTIYWFNPLLSVMRREAERDVETLCDAAVSAGKNREEKLQYSRVLLKTAANMQSRKSFLSSGLNDGSLMLERRLRTVMNREAYKRGFILALCTVLVFTAGNLLTGCTRQSKYDTEQNADGSFETLTPYVFPVTDVQTLSKYSDSERYELLQIPAEQLDKLTDQMLLETIMDYPYGGFMGNIEEFAEKFNGMKEFLERPHAGRTLVEEFKNIGRDDSLERLADIENLIIYFANMNLLSDGERKEFSEEVKDRCSRGYTGCYEYKNQGGKTDTVFLKRLYMQSERMADMLELTPDCLAALRRNLASSTVIPDEKIGLHGKKIPFEVKKDQLFLYVEDSEREYKYIFSIHGSQLIFDREASMVMEAEKLEDGDTFN